MKTILLIDDDSQLRTMFSVALRKEGYRVIEAASGVTGLAAARQHLPDLILSDIHMPGGDGSTLLKDIRRDPELRTKQVVLITGRPDLVTPRKGMEEGADDFLVKPVSLEALRNCVMARLSRASISWRVEDQILANLRSSVPSQLPHEFFTPLAGIIGLMEILRSDSAGLAPEEIHDIYNDVYNSALRLHRTLRNYLLISARCRRGLYDAEMVGCLPAYHRGLRGGLGEPSPLANRGEGQGVRFHPVQTGRGNARGGFPGGAAGRNRFHECLSAARAELRAGDELAHRADHPEEAFSRRAAQGAPRHHAVRA